MRRATPSPTKHDTNAGAAPGARRWHPFGAPLPWRAVNGAIGGMLLLLCLAIWLNAATRPHAQDLPGGLRIADEPAALGATVVTYSPDQLDETGLDGFAAALCGAGRYEIHAVRPTLTDRVQDRIRVRLTCN